MRADAELVQASVGGDRQAFGLIVERYQSLVCAIAYSGTGNLALSQDLAQETFLAAWSGLARLREPGKLKAWLAGIARNLVKGARRSGGVEEDLESAAGVPAAGPTALEQVLDREQEALLWRTLAGLPETYREPLVLFYREGQSVERVAEALDLSRDAVKQRLARGRQMLERQVAAFVEGALGRTRPGKVFTLAVLAALPAAAAPTAAAAVAATAAGGSRSLQGAASAASAGAVLGPLLGMAGAYLGAKASLDATRSARERAFVKRFVWIAAVYALAFVAFQAVTLLAFPDVFATLPAQLVVGLLYTAGLAALILHHNRRQRAIQIEDGTYLDPARLAPPDPAQMSPGAVYGSLAGGIFGGTIWMLPTAAVAGEWTVGAGVLALGLVVWLVCGQAAIRAPRRYYRVARFSLFAVAAINLAVINLRWADWMAAYRRHWIYEPGGDPPVWAMNLGFGLLFAWVLWLLVLQERRQSRSRPPLG